MQRYQKAFELHRLIMGTNASLLNLFENSLVNNMEFLIWSGVPLIILIIAAFIRSCRSVQRGEITRKNILTIAFGLTYLGLNIFGQTRGEVGRLWIFLIPVVAIVASDEAFTLSSNPKRGILFVLLLQLISSSFMFLNLDFL